MLHRRRFLTAAAAGTAALAASPLLAQSTAPGPGSVLPTKLASGAVFSTDVYAQQLKAADADIHRIIQDNLPTQAATKAG